MVTQSQKRPWGYLYVRLLTEVPNFIASSDDRLKPDDKGVIGFLAYVACRLSHISRSDRQPPSLAKWGVQGNGGPQLAKRPCSVAVDSL